jgi:hypothetical protein
VVLFDEGEAPRPLRSRTVRVIVDVPEPELRPSGIRQVSGFPIGLGAAAGWPSGLLCPVLAPWFLVIGAGSAGLGGGGSCRSRFRSGAGRQGCRWGAG